MRLVPRPVAETSPDQLHSLLVSVPQSRPTEHPLPCELREAALKLITGLELERLSPRAAVEMRVKKFK